MSLLLTQGNALRIPLADESVHCVVTSPPYYSLRDYGIDGQLGMEASLEEYIDNMVLVFREVKRVMRHDAVLFLNLGDSYVGGGRGGNAPEKHHDHSKGIHAGVTGLKPKDLMGVPWRVAFALQADGWWLRQQYPWVKVNPMPESADDRPNSAVEFMFLLTKSSRYYFDMEGAKECLAIKRNWRNGDGMLLLDCPTYGFPKAHFATYPPALVEPCIKAGTSERGVCPECGSPWERVVSERNPPKEKLTKRNAPVDGMVKSGQRQDGVMYGSGQKMQAWLDANPKTTLGWQPTCDHDHEPVSAVVFDPFSGSGTTLQVARALGRNGVGLDLSLEYLQLARTRLSLDALDAWTDGAGQSDNGKDNAHKNKQVPGRQTHSFHEARNEKDVTDLPMFEEMT